MATQKKTGGRVTKKKTTPANPLAALDLLASKELARTTVDVITQPDLADEVNETREALQLAKNKLNIVTRAHEISPQVAPEPDPDSVKAIEELEAKLADLREQAAAVTLTFAFSAVAGPRLRALMMGHPPSEEQKKAWKITLRSAGANENIPLEYDENTYPPHLVAESMRSVSVEGKRHAPFDIETCLEMWHGPICEACEGTAMDPEADDGETRCVEPLCDDGRRPDLGKWSGKELEAIFVAAAEPNTKIPKI